MTWRSFNTSAKSSPSCTSGESSSAARPISSIARLVTHTPKHCCRPSPTRTPRHVATGSFSRVRCPVLSILLPAVDSHTRCAYVMDHCRSVEPELVIYGDVSVSCHLHDSGPVIAGAPMAECTGDTGPESDQRPGAVTELSSGVRPARRHGCAPNQPAMVKT